MSQAGYKPVEQTHYLVSRLQMAQARASESTERSSLSQS